MNDLSMINPNHLSFYQKHNIIKITHIFQFNHNNKNTVIL